MRQSLFLRAALVLLFFFLMALGSLASCDDALGTKPTDDTALLAHLTDDVILPETEAFATSADALASATSDLEKSPSATTLAAAQTAWRACRKDFRALDALHFGPVADDGISERIDLAPASASDIEGLVASASPSTAATIGDAGGHAKGFLGVEYFLFSTDGDAAALAVLSGSDGSRRLALAALMAGEIASSAHQLDDAWASDKGNYAGEIKDAGKSSQRYATQRAALDDLVGAVGYGWETVVGIGLAEPLGRKSTGTPDPSLDPTLRSDSAIADMDATMGGVEALYDGDGFSSRVKAKNASEDAKMADETAACRAAIKAIPTPFGASVTNDTAAVQAAYDACKAGKATWNTDVTTALGATLRPSDNDGD